MAKKVGIITLTGSDNCGSLLQAYALQEVLKKEVDSEIEIIDFYSKEQKRLYGVLGFRITGFHTFFRALQLAPWWRICYKQRRDYEQFRKLYLNRTKKKYGSLQQLKKLEDTYEIVVSGSDQVWNVNMYDFSEAFLLPWCQGKKVAYAVSLGGIDPGSYYKNIDFFKTCIKEFQMISVREEKAAVDLEKLLEENVPVLADPTLLLDASEWKSLAEIPMVDAPYIFYYSYNYMDVNSNSFVKVAGEKYNLPVIIINALHWRRRDWKNYNFNMYEKSGPLAFLNLMRHAKYVIVESLHGIIFSTIFQKQFVFLQNKINGKSDTRCTSLLKLLKMEERGVNPQQLDVFMLEKKIDYADNEELDLLKKRSVEFIKKIVDLIKE